MDTWHFIILITPITKKQRLTGALQKWVFSAKLYQVAISRYIRLGIL